MNQSLHGGSFGEKLTYFHDLLVVISKPLDVFIDISLEDIIVSLNMTDF